MTKGDKFINPLLYLIVMIKDRKGLYFSKSKVYGSLTNQFNVTIPVKDWKFFEVGSWATLVSISGRMINRKITSIGAGKQRIVPVKADEHDIFSKGDLIKIYPEHQPTKRDKHVKSNNLE